MKVTSIIHINDVLTENLDSLEERLSFAKNKLDQMCKEQEIALSCWNDEDLPRDIADQKNYVKRLKRAYLAAVEAYEDFTSKDWN